MEVKTDNGNIYIDLESIVSVSMEVRTAYKDEKKEYFVQFGAVGNGMIPQLCFDSEMSAKNTIDKIIDGLKAKDKSEDDYVKGFKDGLEYALKMK